MTEPSDEGAIARLVGELHHWDQNRRREAVLEIIQLALKDERLKAELITLAVNDPDQKVRLAAQKALGAKIPEKPTTKAKPSLTRNEKIRDFLIGFVGWYVVNGTFYWLITRGTSGGGFFNLCAMPANILALIILAIVRRWVAWGMLASYAVNFMIAVVLGSLLNAVCWIPFFIK